MALQSDKSDREVPALIGQRLAGWSASGGLMVGVTSFVVGVAAAVGARFEGAGLCFLAAAVAFGLFANAVFRR